MNKKGLSTIVSTVIIILLAIIGVSFIMLIVFTIIGEGSKKIELETLTIELDLKRAIVLNDSFVEVQVKRNSGEGEISGLAFVFFNGRETEIIKKDVELGELQEKTFVLELQNFNSNELEDVSVAPLLETNSGEIITANIEDKFEFS
jgi:hypothetical protein